MKRSIIFIIALCCLLFTGCGAKITALNIILADSLPVGDTALARVEAAYNKPDAAEQQKTKALEAQEIEFKSSDEKIAAVDAKSGKVTALKGGKVIITAAGKNFSASKEIVILIPLESIKAPEALELIINKENSKKLGAKPMPENANIEGKITYKSSDEKVATVSADGTVTAAANGEAVITIAAGDKTAETKVIVTTAATGIGVDSDSGWIYIGGSYELKPYTIPAEAAASTYTFTSNNTSVASVNDKGVITGKSAGTAKITIKSAEGFEMAYTVTIKAKPAQTATGTGGGAAAGGTGVGNSNGGGATSGGTTETPAPQEPQHYHGNGSDFGVCPACGLNFSPSAGVGGGAGPDLGDWE